MGGTSAALSVTSSGTGTAAVMRVTVQSGNQAGVTLQENSGNDFHLVNHGASDMFKIKDSNDLFTIAASTGDTTIRGGLNVKSGRLVVDSNTGFVGVGGANPSVQLHVNGS